MKAWKQLEIYIAQFLGWERITKKHYGDSVPDLRGDGYTGDSKHYKKHRIHSIREKASMLYKTDVIIFTKEKRTHYVPKNILVTIDLEQFLYLLLCKRKADKLLGETTPRETTLPYHLVTDLIYKLKNAKAFLQNAIKIANKLEKK